MSAGRMLSPNFQPPAFTPGHRGPILVPARRWLEPPLAHTTYLLPASTSIGRIAWHQAEQVLRPRCQVGTHN